MRHIILTKKHGDKVIIHVDCLKQVFVATNGGHSVCVLDVQSKQGGDDTYVVVQEGIASIYDELSKLSYAFTKTEEGDAD